MHKFWRYLLTVLMLTYVLSHEAIGHPEMSDHSRFFFTHQGADSVEVFLLTPLPLLFADEIEKARRERRLLQDPLLRSENQKGQIRYRFIAKLLKTEPLLITERFLRSFELFDGNQAGNLEVQGFSIFPRQSPIFEELAVLQSLVGLDMPKLDPVFDNAFLFLKFRLPLPSSPQGWMIRSLQPPLVLAPGISIENHFYTFNSSDGWWTEVGQMDDEWLPLKKNP